MTYPLQITFRNLRHSDAIAAKVCAEAAKLDRAFKRITSCHLVIEVPHRHHKYGDPFLLRIILEVPRTQIVVERAPSLHSAIAHMDTAKWVKHLETGEIHKDVHSAIQDAFKSARRQLEDYANRLRGDVKLHAVPSPVHANKLFPETVENAPSNPCRSSTRRKKLHGTARTNFGGIHENKPH